MQKWSGLINNVAQSSNTDPKLLFTIMKMESDGNPNAINYNSNGTVDYGLMQINSATAQDLGLDTQRLMTDPEYNLAAAVQEIAQKQAMADRIGLDSSNPFNIFWLYNGYSDQGKQYAQKAMDIYNSMS